MTITPSSTLYYSLVPATSPEFPAACCFSIILYLDDLTLSRFTELSVALHSGDIMTKDNKRINLYVKKIANDNSTDPMTEIEIRCLFPEHLGILSGEVDLVARYLGHILLGIANDNNSDSETNPGK